ncbi:reverse transcriptase domain-containing protein [Tanacetum coccineum]
MDQPIKQLLSKSEISRRMLKWKFELEGYDIQYRPRTLIKGQILADFIVERPDEESLDELMAETKELPEPWTLFTDRSSCIDGSEAELILKNQEGVEFTYAMRFRFEATNNEAKYEALIASLRITEQMGIKNLQANEGMFLGYKVNAEGPKVCQDKADTVLSLSTPRCLKDVQKLNEKLASLNRFLSKSAKKSLPFFKTLKKFTKKSDFEWTQEAEVAFKQMKKLIAELPMLTAPKEKEELIIYLAATKEAISVVLMIERGGKHRRTLPGGTRQSQVLDHSY